MFPSRASGDIPRSRSRSRLEALPPDTTVNLTSAAAAVTIALLAAGNLLLLSAATPAGAGLRKALRRLTGGAGLERLQWWHVATVVAAGLAVVVGYDLAAGLYACPGHPTDIGGFLGQGRALWAGTNPFNVASCGGTIAEPDGLAAVVINALGSLGGLAGIAAVWGAISVALVPLTWWVAGPDRRYLTLVVATSPLYFPLVSAQIDGASNALVPVTVLLALYLASRGETLATGVAGLLATQRFPTLFPVLGLSGSFRRRFSAALALLAVFAAGTGLSYLLWGPEFLNTVLLDQLGRRSFSLNFWGILLLQNWLPAGNGLAIGQAAVTLVLVGVVFFTVRSPLRAAAITLAGVALLTQFLSFNILVWLLPVALVAARPRWWLWGIAVVGSLNYNYAFSVLASTQGILWPSELLDLVLTVLLLGLFVDLWRSPDHALPMATTPRAPSRGDPTRIISAPEVRASDVSPARTSWPVDRPGPVTDAGRR
ncbi:MAG: hypothetical protein ACREDE_04320 [Thermoplasmata archaeon]